MGGGDVGIEQRDGGTNASPFQVNRMKNDTSLTLFHYWNALRGARTAPQRFEIEPARIASILAEAFILERVNFETYRFRIAGTRLCEQFGSELRGRNFLDQWDTDDRFILKRRLAVISQQGQAGLFEFEASASQSDPILFEALILPLVHSSGALDRLIGTISTKVEPAWHEMGHLDRRHLIRHELIWPDGLPSGNEISTARPLPDIRAARLVHVKRRHFRVYEGGLSRRTNPAKS